MSWPTGAPAPAEARKGSIHLEFGPCTRTHEAFDAGGIPFARIHTRGFFVTNFEELFGQPRVQLLIVFFSFAMMIHY